MLADDRLRRLRALIDRLERVPASPESEWMLREARARMVDVETGERPGEMRPLAVDPPDEAPRRQRDAAVKRPTEPPSSLSEQSRERAAPPRSSGPQTSPRDGSRPLDLRPGDDSNAASFGTDGLLWLEDSASEVDASPARDDDDLESRPWRRGLRG
jgi:hypothetical protein